MKRTTTARDIEKLTQGRLEGDPDLPLTGVASLSEATAADVSLSSSAGPGELRVAAPPFPWTVAAGQSREVELQFLRPEASSCVVTILGYTFEVSGLPRP